MQKGENPVVPSNCESHEYKLRKGEAQVLILEVPHSGQFLYQNLQSQVTPFTFCFSDMR